MRNAARLLTKDRWLMVALVVLAALYAWLLQMRPSGEGFGRGWNLVAFWIYGSPPAVAAGAVAWWRSAKAAGALRAVAALAAVLGLAFPVIALLVMRARA